MGIGYDSEGSNGLKRGGKLIRLCGAMLWCAVLWYAVLSCAALRCAVLETCTSQ